MSVPVTQLHILRLVTQLEANLCGLQRELRSNAQSWQSSAQAGTQDVATIAQWIADTAHAYKTRLSWISQLQSDAGLWPRVLALYSALGGSDTDFDGFAGSLKAAADQLSAADVSSHAAIVSACEQLLAYIDAPPNLWPE